jgi:hypothetical protein
LVILPSMIKVFLKLLPPPPLLNQVAMTQTMIRYSKGKVMCTASDVLLMDDTTIFFSKDICKPPYWKYTPIILIIVIIIFLLFFFFSINKLILIKKNLCKDKHLFDK